MTSDAGPDEAPIRLLFDGSDLMVRAAPDFAGDTLMVTLSSRSERGQGKFRPEGFAERFLRKERVPHVCFINKANHWWQTPEFAQAIRAVRESGVLSRFRRVITYGASMGAYGALLAADKLDADLCLAFSPQFRVDGSLPLDPTWKADLKPWPVVEEPFEARKEDPRTEIIVFFDGLHALDRCHAEALEAVHPCRFVLAPGATHSAALYLHEAGLLKDLVGAAVAGTLSPGQTRRRIRASRRADPRYWRGLGVNLTRHGRTDLALQYHRHSVELALAQPAAFADFLHEQIKLLLNATLAAGNTSEAVRLVARYRQAMPREPRGFILASGLERRRGRFKAAVREARQAIALSPRSAPATLALAMALSGGEKKGAARKYVAVAAGLKGASHRDWIEATLVFAGADMPQEAKLAIETARRIKPLSPRVVALAEQYANPVAGQVPQRSPSAQTS